MIKLKKILFFIFILLLAVALMQCRAVYDDHAYPLAFSDHVERYAKEYEVDENLIYAIIRTESGFKTDVVSSAGAIGLMQMMETTYDWVKQQMADTREHVYTDLVDDPDLSIQYGTYLIAQHLEEFGDLDQALAAYHAGRSSVTQWLQDESLTQDGRLITIPSKVTANYIRKVKSAYTMYETLNP